MFRAQEPYGYLKQKKFRNEEEKMKYLTSGVYRATSGEWTLPKASEDEFLITKTPMYSQYRYDRRRIAKEMKLTKPDVKLFLFTTGMRHFSYDSF